MESKKTVEAYLKAKSDWTEGLTVLRQILLAVGLTETVKWGAPCYMHAGRNVVSLAAFKHYFCLWFHEGGSLQDPDDVLQSAEGSKSEQSSAPRRSHRAVAKRDRSQPRPWCSCYHETHIPDAPARVH